ncbi:PREDICTED: golgi-associated plant pathogenesis-related protein 1-like, partial [Phaethon lepturus]
MCPSAECSGVLVTQETEKAEVLDAFCALVFTASKQFAEEVLKAHNDYRKKHGVPPLKLCKKLNRGAQQYAEELATTRVLKHSSESANGKCGENLAWASYDQPGKLSSLVVSQTLDKWLVSCTLGSERLVAR